MPHVVVMGVSGCGKTTVGRLLARHLEVLFIEGDELHPPRNVELMAAGIALTDEDRAGWLDAVAAELARRPEGAVASCSALRRRYRDRLRRVVPALRFVHLRGDRAVLEERLAQRLGHYMPPTLLESQLQTLEPPSADEQPLELDITEPPEALARRAAQSLGALTA